MQSRKQKNLIESKTGLARILAVENLHVYHDENTPTAYIDLTNRSITLPILKDMTGEIYNAFIAHEVSHAIHTPKDGWIEFCKKYPGVFLNVTEDARIERLIQRKYPGLKKDFAIFYKNMRDRDFFQLRGRKLEDFTILDKLNLHFKIGHHIIIPFEDGKEKEFKAKLDNVETFEEARTLAIEVYEYMKDQNQLENLNNHVDLTFTEEDPNDATSESQEGNKSKSGKDNGNQKNSKKIPGGQTRKDAEKNFNREFFDYTKYSGIVHGDVYDATHIYDDFVADIKTCDDKIFTVSHGFMRGHEQEYNNLMVNIKPVISQMVNRFNMKKSALEYKKIKSDRTGKVNSKRLAQYKIRDDIFKSSQIVPDSKNHGLVMYIDFSGSMHQCIGETIMQTIMLMEFCRKIQIPYEVYGFTSGGYSGKRVGKFSVPKSQIFSNDSSTILYHVFSSSEKKTHHLEKCSRILQYCKRNKFSRIFNMGGTPLLCTSFLTEYSIKKFKAMHGVQKVSFILLSDGYSNDRFTRMGGKVHIRNPMTAKNYAADLSKEPPFHIVFKYVKERLNVHSMIGFFLTDSYCSNEANYVCPIHNGHNHQHNREMFDKNKYVTLPESTAFDQFNIVDINNFSLDNTHGNSVQMSKKDMIFLNTFIDNIS